MGSSNRARLATTIAVMAFGVTMAERGVSRLVSVDLKTAEHMRESA